MATVKSARAFWLAAGALVLSACPPPSGSDGGTDAGDPACEALDTRHKQLLNAATTATVVKKEPTFPRDAGR